MSGILIDVNTRTGSAERDLAGVDKSLRNIEKSTEATSRALSGMVSSLGGIIASGLAVVSLQGIADEFANLNNKIALVTGRTNELLKAQMSLAKVASTTRTSLSSSAQTFSSLGKSLKAAGVSTESIVKATQTVQQTIAISGSNAESANAALIQLGQGLSAGALRGEELNSVMEQLSPLAQALADGLGVSLGKLRELGAAGKLTTEQVFGALQRSAGSVSKEFAKMAPTLSQGSTALMEGVKQYVNQLDMGLRLSSSLGAWATKIGSSFSQAAMSGFDLGVSIRSSLKDAKAFASTIGMPFVRTFQALGTQIARVFPALQFTNTIRGDLASAATLLDAYVGGPLVKFRNAWVDVLDVFTIRTNVQKALFELGKLSPTHWVGFGLNKGTLSRLFSLDTLTTYMKAIGNLATAIQADSSRWVMSLSKGMTKFESVIANVAKYLDLSSDSFIKLSSGFPGDILSTMTSFLRSISDVNLKIWNLREILHQIFDDEIVTMFRVMGQGIAKQFDWLVSSSQSAASYIADAFKRLGALLYSTFTAIDFSDIFDKAKRQMVDFFHTVDVMPLLESAYQHIRSFGAKVIRVFFEIYDAVIGHSWWTDTVGNVRDTSATLWDDSKAGLLRFKDKAVGVFEDIYNRQRGIFGAMSKINGIDFSMSNYKLPVLSSSDWSEAFVNFARGLYDTATTFSKQFPIIVATGLNAASALVINALLPPGAAKTALLLFFITGIIKGGALIAEAFGRTLLDESLLGKFGRFLGNIAGTLVSAVITSIPDVLNALTAMTSAFIRGFAEKIPLLGSAFSALFSFADLTGSSGPLGILGTVLLGAGAFKLLSVLGIAEKQLKSITSFGSYLMAVGAGTKGGAVLQFIFGTFGPWKVLAAIGLILDALGSFDSLFAGSHILQFAMEGGLLYVMLFGKKGAMQLVNMVKLQVIAPVMSVLWSAVSTFTAGVPLLHTMLFGAGPASLRMVTFAKGIVDAVIAEVTPLLVTSWGFLRTLFLGTNPTSTVASIVALYSSVVASIVARFAAMSAYVSSFSFFPAGAAAFIGPKIAAMDAALVAFSARVEALFAGLGARMSAFAGANGLVGRVLFGKYGRLALLAIVLTLFAGVASAAETTSQSVQTSLGDSLASSWSTLKINNPWITTLEELATITVPFALVALFKFRREAIRAVASIFTLERVLAFGSAITSMFAGLLRLMQRNALLMGRLATAGIGAALGAYFGGSEWALVGAIMAATLAESFGRALLAAFGKQLLRLVAWIGSMLSGLFALVTSPWTAAAVGAGLLATWLFGEDGKFLDNLKSAWNTISDMFDWFGKKSKIDVKLGISEDTASFAKKFELPATYDVSKIDRSKLSTRQSEDLDERIKAYADALLEAQKQQEGGQKITEDTISRLKDLDTALAHVSANLTVDTQLTSDMFAKAITDTFKFKGQTTIERLMGESRQSGLDRQFNNKQLMYTIGNILSAGTQSRYYQGKQQTLQASKDTLYSASFDPYASSRKYTLELNKTVQDVVFSNEKLNLQINDLEQEYYAAAVALRAAQKDSSTFMGLELINTAAAPVDKSVSDRFSSASSKLDTAYLSKIKFDKETREIKAFQDSIVGIGTAFEKVGIDFPKTGLFTDEASWERLKMLSDEAKRLGEQLMQTSSVAEHNAIIVRIDEIKTQYLQIKAEADTTDLSRKQFKLKEAIEKLGSTPFSEDTLRKLTDKEADMWYAAYTKLFNRFERLKQRQPLSMMPVGTTFGKSTVALLAGLTGDGNEALGESLKGLGKDTKNVLKSFASGSGKDLAEAFKTLKDNASRSISGFTNGTRKTYVENLDTLEADIVSADAKLAETVKSRNIFGFNRDIADAAGIDFSNLVDRKGVEEATRILGKLQSKMSELDSEQSKSNPDQGRVAALRKEIDLLKESANTAGSDISTFMGRIGALGQSLTFSDVASLSPDSYRSLQEADKAMKALEESQKRVGERFTQNDVAKWAATQTAAASRAFEAFMGVVYSSAEKVSQALSRIGLGDAIEQAFLQPEMMGQLLQLDSLILRIQEAMRKPNSGGMFASLQAELIRAQTKLLELKETIASFATRSGAANSVFGISREDFTGMTGQTATDVSQSAMRIQNRLDFLNKQPMSSSAISDSVLKEIRELTAAQKAGTKLAAEQLQLTGARKRADLDSLKYASVDDLVAKITEAVPAFADFKEELSKFDINTLMQLGTEAATISQDKRNKSMGLNTTETRKEAAGAKIAKDNIDIIVGQNDFKTLLAKSLDSAGISFDKSSLNLISDYNMRVLDGMTMALADAKADASKAGDERTRIAAQKLVTARTEELENAMIAATYEVAKIASESGKAFASSIKDSVRTALMSLTSGDFDGTFKTMLNSFVTTIQGTFIDGFMEPLFGEKSVLMQKIKQLGSSIFNVGYDANGFGDTLDPSQAIFSSSVGTFRDAVNLLITSVGGNAIPSTATGFSAGSFSSGGFNSVNNLSGGVNTSDISKDGSGNAIVSATDQSASTISSSVEASNSSLGSVFSGSISDSTRQLLGGFTMIGGLLTTALSAGGSSGKTNWLGIAIGAASTLTGAYMTYSAATAPKKALGGIIRRAAGGPIFDGMGGLLKGPGSGKSDSIHALVSNGEYVVNAESTKKFFPLIQAINSGKLPAFAEGGLIGASPTPTSVDIIKPVAGDTGSTQHFTISVTGDVSRQTRMEIQRMIPNIASGVNSFNREKGNR